MEAIRRTIADAVRSRVVGTGGREQAMAMFAETGPRWFGPDRPIRAVHGDAAAFVGALRALLFQSLHPLAMAGVADHSDFRTDPWGRLQRTAHFLAVTTYGTAEQAQQVCNRVRAVHRRVVGVAPDGRPYAANDPHLLEWVHIAEVDSFLAAHQRYGTPHLTPDEVDAYVADMAVVATALGVIDPPRTRVELDQRLAAFRPELHATKSAREAARFIVFPPMPLTVRAPYGLLVAAGATLLPWWARLDLRLPVLPVTEAVLVRPAGRALTDVMRWALTPGQVG